MAPPLGQFCQGQKPTHYKIRDAILLDFTNVADYSQVWEFTWGSGLGLVTGKHKSGKIHFIYNISYSKAWIES